MKMITNISVKKCQVNYLLGGNAKIKNVYVVKNAE